MGRKASKGKDESCAEHRQAQQCVKVCETEGGLGVGVTVLESEFWKILIQREGLVYIKNDENICV